MGKVLYVSNLSSDTGSAGFDRMIGTNLVCLY
jgi:hypothetical protein